MRTLRMFGYGFLAVVLVLYLAAAGLDPLAIGLVLTLTLIGDTIISLWLTTNADRFGRRRGLLAGSGGVGGARGGLSVPRWGPRPVSPGGGRVGAPPGGKAGAFPGTRPG